MHLQGMLGVACWLPMKGKTEGQIFIGPQLLKIANRIINS